MSSAAETNHLMMFRELIGVCSEIDNETHKCTLLTQLKISYFLSTWYLCKLLTFSDLKKAGLLVSVVAFYCTRKTVSGRLTMYV
jgi:hypothetical protein